MTSPVTAVGSPPITSISCPDDGDDVVADDIRSAVAALLANDAFYAVESPDHHVFGDGIEVDTTTTNRTAVVAEGNGTGRGGSFLGGATGGGVLAVGGGGNAPGVQAQAAGTGPAVECLIGGVKYSGTQPVVTADPGTNTTHATGACKAWALITTDGAGNVTVVDGLNIASAAIASTVLTVTLVNGFPGTAYAVFPASGNTPVNSESVVYEWNRSTSTGTDVTLYGRRQSSGAVTNIDFATTVNTVLVEIKGRQ